MAISLPAWSPENAALAASFQPEELANRRLTVLSGVRRDGRLRIALWGWTPTRERPSWDRLATFVLFLFLTFAEIHRYCF